ncbi:MAG: hypothetical protein JSV84_13535 [Gemmatimonadota bacterium]|nr:MAG: hypothetical protein JSV84_13535 [Gemmatimonadota bacterium]
MIWGNAIGGVEEGLLRAKERRLPLCAECERSAANSCCPVAIDSRGKKELGVAVDWGPVAERLRSDGSSYLFKILDARIAQDLPVENDFCGVENYWGRDEL